MRIASQRHRHRHFGGNILAQGLALHLITAAVMAIFSTSVPWLEFREAMDTLNKALLHHKTGQLKNTIDLTRNDNISNYEFDVFTRLFNPWDKMLETWHLLTYHPAYALFTTYEEMMDRLRSKKPGR